jgi:predicted RNA binding protein YcfA (HicA-like mRNA interferase family)
VKSAELIKRLEKNGWILERIKGSHHQFSHPDFSIVITVPHPRKDMKPGTLHQILKSAKLKE